jgi:hypothetical protein
MQYTWTFQNEADIRFRSQIKRPAHLRVSMVVVLSVTNKRHMKENPFTWNRIKQIISINRMNRYNDSALLNTPISFFCLFLQIATTLVQKRRTLAKTPMQNNLVAERII